MNVNYDSILGINQDPLEYIQKTKTAGIDTKIMITTILLVVILIYVFLFSSLGGNNNSTTTTPTPGLKFIEILMWALFVVLIVVNGYQYFFNVNVVAEIKNLFSGKPEVDLIVQPTDEMKETSVPEITFKKQVFHIPDNKYTYQDAKAVCEAYDAKLATYDQIEDAYNNGGEWCSYGWSADQLALFPTQKDTWNKLQGIEGHKQDCGRPGVNGGYIANPNVRFGINCYGFKPEITGAEAEAMKTDPIYPKSLKDIKYQEKVDYWKNQIPEILVSPFNHNVWSA